MRIFKNDPDRYMRFLYRRQLRRLRDIFENGHNPFKEPDWSTSHYETWDDRELKDEANPKRGWHAIIDGQLRWASAKELRDRYVAGLIKEIDAALAAGAEPSVLEVGCGNGTNLVALKDHYGDRIKLHGFDVANERINIGKQFYGARMEGIDLRIASIADPKLLAVYGRQFGIVYSMHCLEQIPNLTGPAIDNMTALSSGRVVMIEPDWDRAYPVQRVYLVISDHMRTLEKTCRAKGLNIVKAERFEVQTSVKNPSILIVVSK